MNKINWTRIYPYIIFLFLTLLISLPVVMDINNKIFGISGDPFGKIWWIWWQKYIFLNHLPNNYTDLMGAPNGVTIYNFALSVSDYAAKYLAVVFSEISAYNIVILMEVFLAGCSMYWLVLYLTKNKLSAIFSGILFILSPYLMAHSLQHLDLTGIFWFPLIILYLLKLGQKISLKNILLSSLFIGGAISQSFYYAYIALVIAIIFTIYFTIIRVINKKKLLKFFTSILLIGFLGTIVSLPVTYKSLYQFFGPSSSSIKNIQQRYPNELKVYSAEWVHYFTPSPNNPILGRFTKTNYDSSIEKSGSNLTEQSLYLGWIPLLLTIFGIWKVINLKSKIVNLKSYIWFFGVLALIGFYFSFAPTLNILSYEVKTPAYYIFDHLPYFRVYARFGLIVNLSVAILSGMGLSFLLNIIKSKRIALSLYCCTTLLLVVEFLNFPPVHYIDVSNKALPQVYQALENQPKGIVAEYPLLPTREPKGYDYLLWQIYHKFPLVYGASDLSSSDDFRKSILNIEDQGTINKLQDIGTKYIIIHEQKYTPENAKKFAKEYNYGIVPKVNNYKLELIGDFDGNILYRIKNNL